MQYSPSRLPRPSRTHALLLSLIIFQCSPAGLAAESNQNQPDLCASLIESSGRSDPRRLERLTELRWDQLSESDRHFLLASAQSTQTHYEMIQLVQVARSSHDLRWKPILDQWIGDLKKIDEGWQIFIRFQAQKALRELEEVEAHRNQVIETISKQTDSPATLSQLNRLSFEDLSSVRPDFKHTPKYSLEIRTSAIKNQCNLGTCWIYSLVADIEQDPSLKVKNEKISEQFLILQSLLEEIDVALEKPGRFIKVGGSVAKAHELSFRYGLIPDSAWKPRIPFESSPISQRLMHFLNARITKYHLDLAYDLSEESKKAMLDIAKKEIHELIEAFFGPIPTTFQYEGRTFTPTEWRDTQLEQLKKKRITLTPSSTSPLPLRLQEIASGSAQIRQLFEYEHSTLKQISLEQIQEIIIEQLKAGSIIPFSIEMDYSFIDKKSGIMSIHAFYLPENYRPIPKSYRRSFDYEGKYLGHRFHAMDIVGVDLAPDGKVIKYKARNSHGDKEGDQGYFHIYPDYFDTYLVSITIDDSGTL